MKRTYLKKGLCGLLCALLLCTAIPGGLTAAAASYQGSNFTTNAYIASRLDVVLSEFPPGSYFTYSGDPCGHHDSGTCSYFGECNCISNYYDPEQNGALVPLRAVQCLGFERYFFYKLFGFIDMSGNESKYYSLGSIAAGKLTAANVKELVSQAKTGAHVRAGAYHSMLFLSCDENGFWMYHGNTDFCCKVNIRYLTYAEFASKYQSNGIDAVILPVDYPGKDGTITSIPTRYRTGTYRVSDPTGLYLRTGPGSSNTKLRDVPYDTVMNVTEISGVWGKTVFDGLSGWVNLDYAAFLSGYQTGTYRVADAAGLNLREGPGVSHTRLLTVPNGTELTVTAIDGDWGETGYDGKTGWVCLLYTSFVAPTPSPPIEEPPAQEPAVTYQPGFYQAAADDGSSLRSGPSADGEALLTIPNGAELNVTAVDGAWGETTFGGKTGWVSLEEAVYLAPPLTGLALQTLPDKTEYERNEKPDTQGLSLLVTYADGSEQVVTEGYTVTYDFRALGMAEVTVSFRGLTTVFEVEIVRLTADGEPFSGDINGDGNVNSADARMALQYAVDAIVLTSGEQQAGDLTGDGIVDSADAREILSKSVS